MDLAACERRVYRLATLLTGNPVSAAKVIESVLTAQPDLRTLDSAHMDRLTVLRSREIPAATIIADKLPRAIAETLGRLEAQPREAWVFARVYRLPERECARAMDCSVRAFEQHLRVADERFTAIRASEAVEAVRRYSMKLDVPSFHRVKQARRQRWRRVMLGVKLALVFMGLLAVAWVAWRFGFLGSSP